MLRDSDNSKIKDLPGREGLDNKKGFKMHCGKEAAICFISKQQGNWTITQKVTHCYPLNVCFSPLLYSVEKDIMGLHWHLKKKKKENNNKKVSPEWPNFEISY